MANLNIDFCSRNLHNSSYGREVCGFHGPLEAGSPLGCFLFPHFMHLLYIDGSGSVKNPNEEYFILSGVSVFELQIYHLIQRIDKFVESLDLGHPEDIELHASVMAAGRQKPWKGIVRKRRLQIIEDALSIITSWNHTTHALFSIAVHKKTRSPIDPVEYAFEEICNRFDLRLRRLYNRGGRSTSVQQRGLVVMDRSDNYESGLQNLAGKFRNQGTRWGDLRNMAEVPLFVDSRASRIVQLADLVSWAVWRRYEHQDIRYFEKIIPKFDSEGGIYHGLVHYRPSSLECTCPACMSRALRGGGR